MTSSWFFLSTLNYDARSATHQINWWLIYKTLSSVRMVVGHNIALWDLLGKCVMPPAQTKDVSVLRFRKQPCSLSLCCTPGLQFEFRRVDDCKLRPSLSLTLPFLWKLDGECNLVKRRKRNLEVDIGNSLITSLMWLPPALLTLCRLIRWNIMWPNE